MKVYILTLFPRALESYFDSSMMARAREKGLLELEVINLADYSGKATRRSDDRPYGGFPGTIIAPGPCGRAIDALQDRVGPVSWIAPDPRGERLIQSTLANIATFENIGILCGHYEGIDERVYEEYHIQKISLGDYVLTGGEIAAGVILDGAVRLIPGLLSEESLREESFSSGLSGKVEYPHYTRPENWKGHQVPPALRSGDPKKIAAWKITQF